MLDSKPCFLTSKHLRPNYPLFIFLPGMDGTGQLLKTQTEGLETGFDVRCLAIPPTDLTSWEELAAQVVSLTRAELAKAPNRPVYLCGESFGGCLAIKVALHSPELFNRIILINPASAFKQKFWLGWGQAIASWLPEPLYRMSAIWLLPFLARLERLEPLDRQALLKAVQSVPQKTSVWRLSLLNEFTVPEQDYRQITQPVLLLAGGSDRMFPSVLEADRLNHLLPDSKVVILPDCGHACLLEANTKLYEILKEHGFLGAVGLLTPNASKASKLDEELQTRSIS